MSLDNLDKISAFPVEKRPDLKIITDKFGAPTTAVSSQGEVFSILIRDGKMYAYKSTAQRPMLYMRGNRGEKMPYTGD